MSPLPPSLFPYFLAEPLDQLFDWIELHQLPVFCHILLLSALAFWTLFKSSTPPQHQRQPQSQRQAQAEKDKKMAAIAKTAFAAPDVKLDPPKDDPITVEELSAFGGTEEGKPIYVAIKGIVFDVSSKPEMYGPKGGYHLFAGKDGSKGLGKSSLKPEDAVSDYSDLDEKELKVLDDWVAYFTKRYNIVGRVSPKQANL